MRNFIIFIFAFVVSFVSIETSNAAGFSRVAVLPVDVPVKGTSYGLYPNTLSMISGDIVNYIQSGYNVDVIDVNTAKQIINNSGLYGKYKKMLQQYKTLYTFDYYTCSQIARVLGADKIVFVSGGFDTQNLVLKRSFWQKLNFPGVNGVKPSYRLNITTSLVDPYKESIIWDETFSDDFEMKDFANPSQQFAENVVSVKEIKDFSNDVAPVVSHIVYDIVKRYPKSTMARNSSLQDQNINTKEGTMTKDGHFYKINNEYVIENRRNDYKNWVRGNLEQLK